MNKSSSPKKSKLPFYLSLLLVAILVISYFAVPPVNDFFKEAWSVLTSDDEARVKKWVEDFGWFGPVVIVVAMIVQMFLLVIPTILLMIVSTLAYGPIWGSIINFTAVIIASSVGYAIGKYLGLSFIERLLGEKTTKKITTFIENYGFWAVVITRINPFLSNDAISFVAGILKMNYWKFISATAVGITPLILLIAITGQNTDSLKTGLLYGSIASLIVFGGYIWWDKKRRSVK
ncbi:TVP38/TMEM64 family protein [Chryseobacterium sp. SNU WT5]|uniref:TVP38/TMEM64 family protein n=1 Tax=Chryseobacterium sp. SNU WT5 TaxID=2594269 RepID=UPI00117EE7F1|nr:TVP38/TMEM64 family protein [Chryseobacterium sp. SNU WT5]QDP84979.1 TVP38/TMEM64 family protein [Chryseobacterium sp. SNU WT5]